MLILVRIDLTEKGEENKSKVLEEVDYNFSHSEILGTEIVPLPLVALGPDPAGRMLYALRWNI
jgi:hypothetical protein